MSKFFFSTLWIWLPYGLAWVHRPVETWTGVKVRGRRELADEIDAGFELNVDDINVENLVRSQAVCKEALAVCDAKCRVGIYAKNDVECCAAASSGIDAFVVDSGQRGREIAASLSTKAVFISIGRHGDGADFTVIKNTKNKSQKFSKVSKSRANYLESSTSSSSKSASKKKLKRLLDFPNAATLTDEYTGLYIRDQNRQHFEAGLELLEDHYTKYKQPLFLAAPFATFFNHQKAKPLPKRIPKYLTCFCLLDLDSPPDFLTASMDDDLIADFFADEDDDDFLRRRFDDLV